MITIVHVILALALGFCPVSPDGSCCANARGDACQFCGGPM